MRKTIAFGATALLTAMLAGCTGDGGGVTRPVSALYGPPSAFSDSDDDPIEDVYGPPVSPYGEDDGFDYDDAQDDGSDEEPDGDGR